MLEDAATPLKPWLEGSEPPPEPESDDGPKGAGTRPVDVDPDLAS